MAAQEHMERLDGTEAAFLAGESDAVPMHVGSLMLFEGTPPTHEELAEHVRSRIHLVPRFRQKLAFAPLGTGRPFWIDDDRFDLGYHVRTSGLPAPGSEDQLSEMAARVFGARLDRSKPLWELWLVHDLAGGRFALLSKTHHTMVDESGVDLATVLFDPDPAGQSIGAQPWLAQPEPGGASLTVRDAGSLLATPNRIARQLSGLARNPLAGAQQAAGRVRGLGEELWTLAKPPPEVPLNVKVGPHRRFLWVRTELSSFRRIHSALGCTVNDVILAVVAGALRSWLHTRGVRTDGLELRAQVPISIRANGESGNRIASIRAALPVGIKDPIERVRAISDAMEEPNKSSQALSAEVITRLRDFAPPTLLAHSVRVHGSPRLINLVVTNVPGPQISLYLIGRRMCDLFGAPFLWPNHALAVTVFSYDGRVGFGLLGDYDAMEDIGVIALGIEQALSALLDATEQAGAA